MVTILGIVIGLTPIGDTAAIQVIENLDPHVILLLFIPPLIFESAYNSDWHTFRK
jgi:NhaP-type Na+/H+ or K+/H+ antiporter